MTWMNRCFVMAVAAAFLATVAPSTAHAHEQLGASAALAVRAAPKANPLKPTQQQGRRPALAVRAAPKANPLKPTQQQGRRVAVA